MNFEKFSKETENTERKSFLIKKQKKSSFILSISLNLVDMFMKYMELHYRSVLIRITYYSFNKLLNSTLILTQLT